MAPDAAPALFNELTAAAAKGTKWSTYFSVEPSARPKGADWPKGVWLQCLASTQQLGGGPWAQQPGGCKSLLAVSVDHPCSTCELQST